MPIKQYKQGYTIFIKLSPNAKCDKITGLCIFKSVPYLKINIKAPAVENKANKALMIFLSKILNIPQSTIVLTHGLTNSYKQVFIESVAKDILQQKLMKYDEQNC